MATIYVSGKVVKAEVADCNYSSLSLLSDTDITVTAGFGVPVSIGIDLAGQMVYILDQHTGETFYVSFDGTKSGLLSGTTYFGLSSNTNWYPYQNLTALTSIFGKYVLVLASNVGTSLPGALVVIKGGSVIQTIDDSALVDRRFGAVAAISWDGQYIINAFADATTGDMRVRIYRGS